mgnify:CR=1 FL=1
MEENPIMANVDEELVDEELMEDDLMEVESDEEAMDENPRVAKADAQVQKLISQKRIKDSDDRKVSSEIFDKATLQVLYKLANQGYLDVLNGAISTGKEANVLKGIKDDGSIVAVKIYRIATSDFKKMQYYIAGDPRFNVRSSNKRQLINNWVNKEFRNLTRLKDAGVYVPEAITSLNNVLIIEFIGDEDGNPAPTVKNLPPEDPIDFYEKLVDQMDKFKQHFKVLKEYFLLKIPKHWCLWQRELMSLNLILIIKLLVERFLNI